MVIQMYFIGRILGAFLLLGAVFNLGLEGFGYSSIRIPRLLKLCVGLLGFYVVTILLVIAFAILATLISEGIGKSFDYFYWIEGVCLYFSCWIVALAGMYIGWTGFKPKSLLPRNVKKIVFVATCVVLVAWIPRIFDTIQYLIKGY